ncbi:melanoma-associated antigen B2 [Fukomys damarensis]|uniref:Melanoma-associated antigen B4 n=1 Tax=Fukomys damarensis TaxID=885580 RepID=A0A091CLC9_FUKDA|nr:melanoma-associated antigen B2 [Fukomys damarensis]KFO19574.1 Melanoma-associated antigen B4 [Fukomys damarensis]
MLQGKKSKLRAHEKRCPARGEIQCLPGAQEGETPSCSSLSGDAAPSSYAGAVAQKSQGAPPTTSAAALASFKKSGKVSKKRREQKATSFTTTTPTEVSEKELLMKKAGMLMNYLLYKYQMKENVIKGEMVQILHKRFRPQFPEILQLTLEWAELLFGLELKEVKPGGGIYILVKKLDDSNSGSHGSSLEVPMNGLLMPLLGLIFLNGNSASEEELWEFLNKMGIYDATDHLIFGEARKFITKDLVQKKYLVYRQVLPSDPPRYEFMWGPRAHVEVNKMKILEFLAKVNETVPSAFPSHYVQASRDEEERAEDTAAASQGTAAQSIPGPGETSNVCPPE